MLLDEKDDVPAKRLVEAAGTERVACQTPMQTHPSQSIPAVPAAH